MILAVNIGNTNIRCALGARGKFVQILIPSGAVSRPGDFITLLEKEFKGQLGAEVEGSVIASVVPGKTSVVSKAIKNVLNIPSRFVDAARCGIDISGYGGTLGQDRAVCAAADAEMYPLPLIVADFGTTTTVNVISSEKKFMGGAILPGVRMSFRAHSQNTALLPEIDDLSAAYIIYNRKEHKRMSGVRTGNRHGFSR